MSYTQDIRIRYGEVDAQGVVFNAHYLAYLDDVTDTWLRNLDGEFEETGWEVMLRRADLTWHGSAGVHDVLTVDAAVTRWGTTSFDVAFEARVDGQLVLTATVFYVGVSAVDHVPTPPPSAVRAHLGG
ncbi:MAG: thioesterase family protein [Acidimicrobiales bacterium]|nr:thioesterase family protein [Acidimicrobiales bacterium]